MKDYILLNGCQTSSRSWTLMLDFTQKKEKRNIPSNTYIELLLTNIAIQGPRLAFSNKTWKNYMGRGEMKKEGRKERVEKEREWGKQRREKSRGDRKFSQSFFEKRVEKERKWGKQRRQKSEGDRKFSHSFFY